MTDRVPVYNWMPLMQGDTWSAALFVKDNNGAAYSLSGYSAQMDLREREGAPLILSLSTTAGSGITITAATGRIDLLITKTQSAAIYIAKPKYNLRLTAPDGTVQSILRGEFSIIPRITI